MKKKTIYWIVGIIVVIRIINYMRKEDCEGMKGGAPRKWRPSTNADVLLGFGSCQTLEYIPPVDPDFYHN